MLETAASVGEIRDYATTYVVPARKITRRIFAPLAAAASPGDHLTFETIERIEGQFRLFVEAYKPLQRHHFSHETLDLVVRFAHFLPVFASLPWAQPEDAEPTYTAVRTWLARCPSDPQKQKHGATYVRTCIQHFFPHLKGCPDSVSTRDRVSSQNAVTSSDSPQIVSF